MEQPILDIILQLPELIGEAAKQTITIDRDPVIEGLPGHETDDVYLDSDEVMVKAFEGQHLEIEIVATDAEGRQARKKIKTQARSKVLGYIGEIIVTGVNSDDDIAEEPAASHEPTCRVCGCTEGDCSQCKEVTGEACSWVDPEKTICTRCAAEIDAKAEADQISKADAESAIIAAKAAPAVPEED